MSRLGLITFLSFAAGGVVTIAGFLDHSPDIDTGRVFQREDKPLVMRLYRSIGRDGIYVDSGNGEYVTLNKYLRSIKSEGEREVERAAIKKAVSWYNN